MEEERFMPAGIDERLYHESCQAFSPVLIQGVDPVDLQPVLVPPATGDRHELSVDKCSEHPVDRRVGSLLVVVVPDVGGEREFGGDEFADGGGGRGHC